MHHCCSKHHEYRKVKHVNLYKIYEGAFYSVTPTKRPVAALCNPLVQRSSHSSSLVQNTVSKRWLPESPVESQGSLPCYTLPTQPQQNTCNLNTLEGCLEWSKMEFPPPYALAGLKNTTEYTQFIAQKLWDAPNKWVGHIGKVST